MDRNKLNLPLQIRGPESLSARRAWIEMSRMIISVLGLEVALRKESVDRNIHAHIVCMPFGVALRKESVDRNDQIMQGDPAVFVSLSARRAWIEMPEVSRPLKQCAGRSPQGERG